MSVEQIQKSVNNVITYLSVTRDMSGLCTR